MKVIFICPRSFYFYERTPYLSLGIAYLVSSISSVVDEIDCIDGQILEENEYEQAISVISSDVICISATLLQMKEAFRISKIIKKRLPLCKIIIGGYGPESLSPEELFFRGDFDIFIRGEAEIRLKTVLDLLKRGKKIEEVPGIVFKRGNKIILSKSNFFLPDVDCLAFPSREIFDVSRYLNSWKKNTGMTSLHLISSRGCPFNCSFCDKSLAGRRCRYRDEKSVVEEMSLIWRRYSPDDLFLFDDLFTFKKDRVLSFCKEIGSKRLPFKWSAQSRVGTVDLETLSAMKDSGCTELFFGIESGSNRILSYINKGFSREAVLRTFSDCHEVGLPAGMYLIVGIPGERKEDIDLTIDLVKKTKPSLLNFSFLIPFPNTEIYKKTKQWIGETDWSKWDDFNNTIYNYPFEIDPVVSRQRIFDVYKKMVENGLPHSEYQLL